VVVADRVQQEQAVVGHHPPHRVEVGGIVLDADVLEHSDRHHPVERPVDVPVVHQLDAHRESGAALAGQRRLLARDGDAEHLHAVVRGGEPGETAPATADVQQALARLQLELAANEPQLLLLRLGEGRRVGPVTARVAHRRVEHGLEDVVADVVPRRPAKAPGD